MLFPKMDCLSGLMYQLIQACPEPTYLEHLLVGSLLMFFQYGLPLYMYPLKYYTTNKFGPRPDITHRPDHFSVVKNKRLYIFANKANPGSYILFISKQHI